MSPYQTRGGIVDLHITNPGNAAELIRDGRLELRVGAGAAVTDRQLVAHERELIAFCDDACLYLEDGENRQVAVTVRERGAVPTTQLSLVVAIYGGRSGPETRDPLQVPESGTVTVSVGGGERVVEHLSLIVADGDAADPVPQRLPLGTVQFLTVRTLPADDGLAAVPDSDLSWELVFTEVLSHYHAVTPRMSTILDLSDPDAVRTFAARILDVTEPHADSGSNPPPFESARYMPVTRDMSANRRQLLRRYCAMLLGERLPEPVPAVRRDRPAPTRAVRESDTADAPTDEAGIEGSFPKTARGEA